MAIRAEAEAHGTSLSSLMSQIVTKYVKRDRYFEQLGFVPIAKEVLRKWLSRIEEKFLIEDSEELGSSIGREYISYFFHDVNSYTLLKFLDLYFSRFQSYHHNVNGDMHSFAVNHGINIQYSICMKEFLKALIEPIISKQVKFMELTPDVINFSFET